VVQDKDKLKDVGLMPEKPAGHIRAIWALTLILAFAIIVVGGVYFILWYSPWGENLMVNKSTATPSPSGSSSASPSSSAKSDYKTYTEANRGAFSFEYPKDWKILKSNPYDDDAERMELVYENEGVLNTSLVAVEDIKNSMGTSVLRDIVKDLASPPADQFLSDAQLGGKAAIKASGMEGMPPQIIYYALNNGYILKIMGVNYEGDTNLTAAQQKNKATFEHIISSWKWL
jgi:hypothetical protein